MGTAVEKSVVGARQPLNWNVSPKSPEGRTAYEGAPGIKQNETKRNESTSWCGGLDPIFCHALEH